MGSPNIFQERSWVIMNIAPLVDQARIQSRAPLKINCRCPVCGDSKKSRKKKRGYFLEGKEGIFFTCHNCGWSGGIKRLIREEWPHLEQDFVFSRFQNQMDHEKQKDENDPENEKWTATRLKSREQVETDLEKLIEPVSGLKTDHPVVTYIRKRMIPEKHLKDIWFTTSWPAAARTVDPDSYPEYMQDWHQPRLVFQCRDASGKLLAIQGRALRPGDFPKYVTVKSDPDNPKIWGMDQVDLDRTVFLQEGIMDCFFIPNSAAILGAALGTVDDWIPNRTWVLDDEPRAPQTVKHMEKLVARGESVVCWDREQTPDKDINGKVMAGTSPEKLHQYLLDNQVSGLQATLRIKNWRKS